MPIQETKVGIVSCSGEELPGGTVSRLACRKVLDQLRPNATVTICLPLYIAGGEEERAFAKDYPTITVDGCEKLCAAKATEKLSGKPTRSLLIPEILKNNGLATPQIRRNYGPNEAPAIQAVADEIANAVDEILATGDTKESCPRD